MNMMMSLALDKEVTFKTVFRYRHIYPMAIDAVAQGLAVIDAGHYGIEHIFIQDMAAFLSEKLKGVKIISAPLCHPFTIV